MDPRLPYAFAAMASIVPDDADDATVSQFTTQAMVVAAQLLKAPDGLCSIQSGRWHSPARSERERLMCAVPVGIALSTIDPEAFARTVWFACGCTTRDEFQSAALLAAAVSLALDSYDAPTGEAVEFVAALPSRGEAEDGPDILTATRRAMNVLSNSKWVYYWSPINLLRQKLAAHSSSSLVIPLAFYIPPLSYSSAISSEIAELSGEEAKEFLAAIGLTESGLDRLIKKAFSLLNLMTFLTAGEDECRAWTITRGTTAPKAAGKIHTDFERGFIRAEIVNYDDLVALGSVAAARDKGLVRLEGKDYVMRYGDVVNFRFNV